MSELDSVIEGCKNGDAARQRELYDKYAPRYYALCRRYAVDDAVAQEMLTEGFLNVFKYIGSYRGEGSFEGWMRSIFMRMIFRIHQRESRHEHVSIESSVMEVPHKEDHGLRMDVREALLNSLRTLSEEDRTLFNMIAVEEYSFVEAAQIYGKPVTTLKSKYYKVRDCMREKMKKYLE